MMNHQTPILFLILIIILSRTDITCHERIDRHALVSRHNPSVTSMDILSPFSVGNGEFAFTPDFTGLQSYAEYYERGIPLTTQSQWGWHTLKNPEAYSLDQTLEYYPACGKTVPYASRQYTEAGKWLRANPHRLHLGKIGFRIKKPDGSPAEASDIADIRQTLDLWEGRIQSRFSINGHPIEVETCCHPETAQIAVRFHSKLLKTGCVAVAFDFPYGTPSWGPGAADWNSPEKHTSEIILHDEQSVTIRRTLDSSSYHAVIRWKGRGCFIRTGKHTFLLEVTGGTSFSFTCCYSQNILQQRTADTESTFHSSRMQWRQFWETGGAVDLSGSLDSRAPELERRIVLSQYLTAIQCTGSLPPQETGLTCYSWYGKFHLEMHWWHAAHFALWNRPELLEKSLSWYKSIQSLAREQASSQGFRGVRWPKMTDPGGKESPSSIGVFLIWQEPHPIYYAELLYRSGKDHMILEKYKDMVFETADFMASYACVDDNLNRAVLGPALIPAQEIYGPDSTINPAFELAYWKYGLKTAQDWRERMGLPRDEKWDYIINSLSPLPQNHGLYQNIENISDTFENPEHRKDHPSLLGAFGMLNSDADIAVMRNTLDQVLASWDWNSTWGWDFPLIAMTAARVGCPEKAVDALLMQVPKNTFLNNGHNYQTQTLPVYLPGNGGLLAAVAMMAAGWDGAPPVPAPGFPRNGMWNVKAEGLNPLP